MLVCVAIFVVFTALILVWSRAPENFFYHRGRRPLLGIVILCRTRIILGLEIAGIFLLIWKLMLPGPDQEQYNELLANALLANAHATSMLYQALRKEIPATIPDGFVLGDAEIPKTIKKVPEKLYDELHLYVRRSSLLLAEYFGRRFPECSFGANARKVGLLDLSPDTELVGIELVRINAARNSICGEASMKAGMSQTLSLKNLQITGIEILGGIFLLFAAALRIAEIRMEERRHKNPKAPLEWYWDKSSLKK